MEEAGFLGLGLETWKYISMPVISAVVGYVTNVIAIRMMFHPLEFIGIKEPILGWQGIVPRKCAKMAGIAVDTITSKLLDEEEIFSRLDPQRIADELEQPTLAMVDEITEAVMRRHQPLLWESLPGAIKRQIIRRVQGEAPTISTPWGSAERRSQRDSRPRVKPCRITVENTTAKISGSSNSAPS